MCADVWTLKNGVQTLSGFLKIGFQTFQHLGVDIVSGYAKIGVHTVSAFPEVGIWIPRNLCPKSCLDNWPQNMLPKVLFRYLNTLKMVSGHYPDVWKCVQMLGHLKICVQMVSRFLEIRSPNTHFWVSTDTFQISWNIPGCPDTRQSDTVQRSRNVSRLHISNNSCQDVIQMSEKILDRQASTNRCEKLARHLDTVGCLYPKSRNLDSVQKSWDQKLVSAHCPDIWIYISRLLK